MAMDPRILLMILPNEGLVNLVRKGVEFLTGTAESGQTIDLETFDRGSVAAFAELCSRGAYDEAREVYTIVNGIAPELLVGLSFEDCALAAAIREMDATMQADTDYLN